MPDMDALERRYREQRTRGVSFENELAGRIIGGPRAPHVSPVEDAGPIWAFALLVFVILATAVLYAIATWPATDPAMLLDV